MIINYISPILDLDFASYRYRYLIPGMELTKNYNVVFSSIPTDTATVCIFSKHYSSKELDYANSIKGHKGTIYDLCDYHLDLDMNRAMVANHVKAMMSIVDIITVSSEYLKFVLHSRHDVPLNKMVVIEDPYEYPEQPIDIQSQFKNTLIWYGHQLNLNSLVIYNSIFDDYTFYIITRLNEDMGIPQDRYIYWTYNNLYHMFNKTNTVLITFNKKRRLYKSANRAIEAIRMGKVVISEYLPSCKPLEDYIWMAAEDGSTTIEDGLKCISQISKDELEIRLRAGQNYIRNKYSPSTIAKKWEDVMLKVSKWKE